MKYWKSELVIDGDYIWINVGYSCPLLSNKRNFQSILATSAYLYSGRFN